MVSVGPTAIVIFILFIIFAFLYWLADRVDKEEEARKEWDRYNKELREYEEQWWDQQWQ